MATLRNVNPELADRVGRMIALEPSLWVSSGWRDPAEQLVLWNRWQAALRKYGPTEARKHAALAARPGTSNHEKTPALATDVACVGGKENRRAELARECGLHTPVPGELWHMELRPGRTPLRAMNIQAPKEKPPMPKIPEAVDATLIPGWKAPDGQPGRWILKDDGGVWAYPEGAPFHGSMGGKPLNAPMAGIVSHGSGGYWLIGQDGGIFAFGDAPVMVPYPKFFDEWRVGAHSMTDADFDGEVLTLIASDGGFYSYAVQR